MKNSCKWPVRGATILRKNGQKQPKGQIIRENTCYSNVVMPREWVPAARNRSYIDRIENMDATHAFHSVSGYKVGAGLAETEKHAQIVKKARQITIFRVFSLYAGISIGAVEKQSAGKG